jgi:hypothetical protein
VCVPQIQLLCFCLYHLYLLRTLVILIFKYYRDPAWNRVYKSRYVEDQRHGSVGSRCCFGAEDVSQDQSSCSQRYLCKNYTADGLEEWLVSRPMTYCSKLVNCRLARIILYSCYAVLFPSPEDSCMSLWLRAGNERERDAHVAAQDLQDTRNHIHLEIGGGFVS